VEKANSLIEAEDDNIEPLTGGGALSGPVPSGSSSSLSGGALSGAPLSGAPGAAGPVSAAPSSAAAASGTHRRALKPVESGVFSGVSSPVTGEQLVDSLQAALSAASRGEAGLGSLHRSVRDASRALTSLRHSQESLGEELRVMYRGLNEVMSEKAAVERYAALLTQERDAALDAAEEARREAKREREFLLREQDRFIQLLLEEHEAELQQLRRALSGRSSAPPAVVVKTEPTTGFRIGVPSGERPSRPGEAALFTRGDITRGDRAGSDAAEKAPILDDETVFVRPLEERRAVVPMPRRDADEARVSGAPLGRLQLASVPSGDASEEDVEGPHTERGIGERDEVMDRSLTERNLLDTMRSEVPLPDAEGTTRTYPPAPAVLDLDSLAAEVEGNSERPPPIRRIGGFEPVHLQPARLPQLFDTMVSVSPASAGTNDDEPADES
jgi:hypothetical protein